LKLDRGQRLFFTAVLVLPPSRRFEEGGLSIAALNRMIESATGVNSPRASR